MPIQTFFSSANCTVLVFKLCILFQTILDLWPVLILEIFRCWDIKNVQFQFLVTFSVVFFWSANCTNQVCISPHLLSILSLLFVAIFPVLEMLKFWSVNYICQTCKLYFYFGHVRNFGQYLVLSMNSESVLLLALVKYMLCSHFTQNCIFCTFWRLKILVL